MQDPGGHSLESGDISEPPDSISDVDPGHDQPGPELGD